jgi:hypothetical protein
VIGQNASFSPVEFYRNFCQKKENSVIPTSYPRYRFSKFILERGRRINFGTSWTFILSLTMLIIPDFLGQIKNVLKPVSKFFP